MSIDRPDFRTSLPPQAVTSFDGLRDLKLRAVNDAPEALAAVAQQFEALFLNMMLDSMRAATVDSGLDDSGEGDLYQQLFDRQVASSIADGRGIGIARMLVEHLSRTLPGGDGSAADTSSAPAASNPSAAAPAGIAASPEEFIEKVLPHARQAADALGVHPLALVAQAALETAWGARMPSRADGTSSMNLFGIKTGSGWQGERVAASTLEFENGIASRRREAFRAYDSIEQSFADYVRLLGRSPRYAQALAAGQDPARFADALQAAGYATDPAYASKVQAILASEPMVAARERLKDGGGEPIT